MGRMDGLGGEYCYPEGNRCRARATLDCRRCETCKGGDKYYPDKCECGAELDYSVPACTGCGRAR